MKYCFIFLFLVFTHFSLASENECSHYIDNPYAIKSIPFSNPKVAIPNSFFRGIGTSYEYILKLRTYFYPYKETVAIFIRAKQAGASDEEAWDLIVKYPFDVERLNNFVSVKEAGLDDEMALFMTRYHTKDRIDRFLVAVKRGVSPEFAKIHATSPYVENSLLILDAFLEAKKMGANDEEASRFATRTPYLLRDEELRKFAEKYKKDE